MKCSFPKYFVLLLLLLLKGQFLCSQKLSGYVKDSESGEFIAGVSVRGPDGRVSATNDHGYYVLFMQNGRGEVVFSFMGYEAKEVELNIVRDTIVNILLVPREYEIDEIVVSASRKLVRNTGFGNLSVDIKHIKYTPLFLGERDVFKFLQLLPGISPGKEGSSGLNIRGGSSDQSLIMLDDIPIYNQTHTFGFLSIFSGDALSSVELFKGHIPAQYGGRLSGVASMQMRRGNSNEHHHSITIGTLSAGLMFEGPLLKKRGSYIFTARRFIPDLILKASYAIDKPDSKIAFSFYDLTGKISYNLNDKNILSLNFFSGRDRFDATIYQKEILTDNVSSGGYWWGNIAGSIRLNTVLKSNLFINSSLYYTRQNNVIRGFVETSKQNYKSMTSSSLDEMGIKITAEQNISPYFNMRYGLQGAVQWFSPNTFVSRGDHNESYNHYKKSLYNGAFFIDNNIKYGKLNMSVGLRAAYYNNVEDGIFSIEPRLSVLLDISDKMSLWSSYTMNSQPLVSSEQAFVALPLDLWAPYAGQFIQQAQQFSIGSKMTPIIDMDITMEAYYKPMKNIALIYDSDDFLSETGGVDYSKGEAYGIELSGEYSKSRYGMNLSYTYSRSFRIVDGGKELFIYDTPHTLNLLTHYDVVKQSPRTHTLSINANYKTGLPFIYSDEVFYTGFKYGTGLHYDEIIGNNTPKYANARLPDYFRVDLSYSMERAKKKGTRVWQFSVLNLLNRKNIYTIYRTRDIMTNKLLYKQVVLIPFLPSISYKRTF